MGAFPNKIYEFFHFVQIGAGDAFRAQKVRRYLWIEKHK